MIRYSSSTTATSTARYRRPSAGNASANYGEQTMTYSSFGKGDQRARKLNSEENNPKIHHDYIGISKIDSEWRTRLDIWKTTNGRYQLRAESHLSSSSKIQRKIQKIPKKAQKAICTEDTHAKLQTAESRIGFIL